MVSFNMFKQVNGEDLIDRFIRGRNSKDRGRVIF